MEAESELLEIQTMLSMFDDIPAKSTTSSKTDKPCQQNAYPTTKTALDIQGHQLQGHDQVSDREQSLIVTDNHRDCGGTVTTGDDMDIESILQEMNTIDGKGTVAQNYIQILCCGMYKSIQSNLCI